MRLNIWRTRWPVILGVVATLLVLGAALAAAQDPQPGVLDNIRDVYRTAANGWRARLLPLAQTTFVVLAGIEFAISGAIWALRRDSLDEIAAKFVLKFALVAFLLAVLTAFATWVVPLINGFVFAGETAIGRGMVSPSDVVEIGRLTAVRILRQLTFSVIVQDVAMAMFATLCALLVALTYIWIAAQLVLVLIEGYLVILGGGVLFFGFASSRWTAALAENVIAYALYVGIKMFLLYLIVGLGTDIARSWIPLIQNSDFFGPASPIFEVIAGAVIFALVATLIPGKAATRLTGNHSLGLADALRALT